MSGTNESYLVRCMHCGKALMAKDVAYLIGEVGSGMGMCEDCVKADTEESEDDIDAD